MRPGSRHNGVGVRRGTASSAESGLHNSSPCSHLAHPWLICRGTGWVTPGRVLASVRAPELEVLGTGGSVDPIVLWAGSEDLKLLFQAES